MWDWGCNENREPGLVKGGWVPQTLTEGHYDCKLNSLRGIKEGRGQKFERSQKCFTTQKLGLRLNYQHVMKKLLNYLDKFFHCRLKLEVGY